MKAFYAFDYLVIIAIKRLTYVKEAYSKRIILNATAIFLLKRKIKDDL